MSDYVEWLYDQRESSNMTVSPASLETLEGWRALEEPNGRKSFGRTDNKFFRLVGAIVKASREVAGWGQPLLEELGSPGVVVLVKDDTSVLLQAVAEPGNNPEDNFVLLRATLQTSRSNLEQAHGGKKPQRAEVFEMIHEADWIRGQQDGGRFLNKVDNFGILEVPDLAAWVEEHGGLLPNERIFNYVELSEVILNGECNQHLREIVGILWASETHEFEIEQSEADSIE